MRYLLIRDGVLLTLLSRVFPCAFIVSRHLGDTELNGFRRLTGDSQL